MQRRFHTIDVIVLLSGMLGLSACSHDRPANHIAQISEPVPSPSITATPFSPQPVSQTLTPEPFQLALAKADSATNLSQYAQSKDDWDLAIGQWQQAIQLMQSVPPSSPQWMKAKAKLAEFQRSLNAAKKHSASDSQPANGGSVAIAPGESRSKTVNGGVEATTSASKPGSFIYAQGNHGVFRAKIKRREQGTPVIDVVFNGGPAFEMIVDTGASGTVITEEMAALLGAPIVGKANVDTASETEVQVPLAHVKSISVGGVTMKEATVAIAGPALTIGLLGHDFFGNFDVTIKRDVVEFRQR